MEEPYWRQKMEIDLDSITNRLNKVKDKLVYTKDRQQQTQQKQLTMGTNQGILAFDPKAGTQSYINRAFTVPKPNPQNNQYQSYPQAQTQHQQYLQRDSNQEQIKDEATFRYQSQPINEIRIPQYLYETAQSLSPRNYNTYSQNNPNVQQNTWQVPKYLDLQGTNTQNGQIQKYYGTQYQNQHTGYDPQRSKSWNIDQGNQQAQQYGNPLYNQNQHYVDNNNGKTRSTKNINKPHSQHVTLEDIFKKLDSLKKDLNQQDQQNDRKRESSSVDTNGESETAQEIEKNQKQQAAFQTKYLQPQVTSQQRRSLKENIRSTFPFKKKSNDIELPTQNKDKTQNDQRLVTIEANQNEVYQKLLDLTNLFKEYINIQESSMQDLASINSQARYDKTRNDANQTQINKQKVFDTKPNLTDYQVPIPVPLDSETNLNQQQIDEIAEKVFQKVSKESDLGAKIQTLNQTQQKQIQTINQNQEQLKQQQDEIKMQQTQVQQQTNQVMQNQTRIIKLQNQANLTPQVSSQGSFVLKPNYFCSGQKKQTLRQYVKNSIHRQVKDEMGKLQGNLSTEMKQILGGELAEVTQIVNQKMTRQQSSLKKFKDKYKRSKSQSDTQTREIAQSINTVLEAAQNHFDMYTQRFLAYDSALGNMTQALMEQDQKIQDQNFQLTQQTQELAKYQSGEMLQTQIRDFLVNPNNIVGNNLGTCPPKIQHSQSMDSEGNQVWGLFKTRITELQAQIRYLQSWDINDKNVQEASRYFIESMVSTVSNKSVETSTPFKYQTLNRQIKDASQKIMDINDNRLNQVHPYYTPIKDVDEQSVANSIVINGTETNFMQINQAVEQQLKQLQNQEHDQSVGEGVPKTLDDNLDLKQIQFDSKYRFDPRKYFMEGQEQINMSLFQLNNAINYVQEALGKRRSSLQENIQSINRQSLAKNGNQIETFLKDTKTQPRQPEKKSSFKVEDINSRIDEAQKTVQKNQDLQNATKAQIESLKVATQAIEKAKQFQNENKDQTTQRKLDPSQTQNTKSTKQQKQASRQSSLNKQSQSQTQKKEKKPDENNNTQKPVIAQTYGIMPPNQSNTLKRNSESTKNQKETLNKKVERVSSFSDSKMESGQQTPDTEQEIENYRKSLRQVNDLQNQGQSQQGNRTQANNANQLKNLDISESQLSESKSSPSLLLNKEDKSFDTELSSISNDNILLHDQKAQKYNASPKLKAQGLAEGRSQRTQSSEYQNQEIQDQSLNESMFTKTYGNSTFDISRSEFSNKESIQDSVVFQTSQLGEKIYINHNPIYDQRYSENGFNNTNNVVIKQRKTLFNLKGYISKGFSNNKEVNQIYQK